LAGDHGRAEAVAVFHHFEQVLTLDLGQRAKAPVVRATTMVQLARGSDRAYIRAEFRRSARRPAC
jgi:hypothetical protein